MNAKQKKRLMFITFSIGILTVTATLVLYALKKNINLFYTPTQLYESTVSLHQSIRIGGYVKKQSVQYDTSGQNIRFIVTDNKNDLYVNYHGILPNLFREGQGVVITGILTDHIHMEANQVLAKHDEKYMPPSLKKALQEGKNT